jgi:hypothetical protein
MPTDRPSSTLDAVHRIRKELDALAERQSKALQNAIYLGMTPDEDKQCDERRRRIAELVRQLDHLTKAG